jgi:glycosyltransferase 2 family protein
MRRAGPLIAVALAATLAVPILLGGRDALWQALDFSTQGYLILLAVIALSWFTRALKVSLMLHRLGVRASYAQVFGISLATDFAFISTPAGIGGYAASMFYLRRAGASMSGAGAITAADQVLDWTFFAVALPIAGFALLGANVPEALALLAFGTSAFMVALAIAALIARRRLAAWLFGDNFFSRRWPRVRRRLHQLREFTANLRSNAGVLLAGGPGFLCSVFALAMLQWLSRYGVLWVALLLLGHPVSYALTLLLQALVLHAAMWTGMPSGGGGAELGLSAALGSWVPATSMATALLLWRMATLYLCLIAGAIAIALLARQSTPAAASNVSADTIEEGAG